MHRCTSRFASSRDVLHLPAGGGLSTPACSTLVHRISFRLHPLGRVFIYTHAFVFASLLLRAPSLCTVAGTFASAWPGLHLHARVFISSPACSLGLHRCWHICIRSDWFASTRTSFHLFSCVLAPFASLLSRFASTVPGHIVVEVWVQQAPAVSQSACTCWESASLQASAGSEPADDCFR